VKKSMCGTGKRYLISVDELCRSTALSGIGTELAALLQVNPRTAVDHAGGRKIL